MNTDITPEACPIPGDHFAPRPGLPPFSPLGWSAWRRLAVSLGACAALWAVVLWALD